MTDDSWLRPLRRRTVARWAGWAFRQESLFRRLQFDAIHGSRFTGRTMDVGGTSTSSYYKRMSFEGGIDSININPKLKPTVVHDLNQAIPLAGASYDNVISLNTFEHVLNEEMAISEAVRILKPGGSLMIIIPWMYREHSSPHDYHRHTGRWWFTTLERLGCCDIAVAPLAWSSHTAALALRGNGLATRVLSGVLGLFPVIRDRLCGSPSPARSTEIAKTALGWHITARKRALATA